MSLTSCRGEEVNTIWKPLCKITRTYVRRKGRVIVRMSVLVEDLSAAPPPRHAQRGTRCDSPKDELELTQAAVNERGGSRYLPFHPQKKAEIHLTSLSSRRFSQHNSGNRPEHTLS